MSEWNNYNYFGGTVSTLECPQFLPKVKKVADRYLKFHSAKDTVFEITQTNHIFEEELTEFATYVAQSSWLMLDNQGYDVKNFTTVISELWCQQFDQFGMQPEHVHSNSYISGFYFLEVPTKSSRPTVHDINQVKKMMPLKVKDKKTISLASTAISFTPKVGELFLFNSWLPHSFSPHKSKKPFKFIHFNVAVVPNQTQTAAPQEAIVV